METTRPPMVTHMRGQMCFYTACRCGNTHSGGLQERVEQERVEQEQVEGVALCKRVLQTLKGDSALRNTRNTHMCECVCLSTNTHSHTHTSLMRAPYIIFVHNLICLSPAVYSAMVTGPTPAPLPPSAADTPSFDSLRGCISQRAAALLPRTRRIKGEGGRRMKGRGGGGREVRSDHTPRAQSATVKPVLFNPGC